MAWNLPEGVEPSLEAQAFFDPGNFVYPFGTHIVVVEIDKETGEIELKRYIAVDDVGRVINPLTSEGQVHGGIAQGVGQAMWEEIVYGDDGQLLSGSFMDYTMPKARFFPEIETTFTETPSPVNPLGSKGIGETGTTASIAAVMNAVVDALKPYGVTDMEMPLPLKRYGELFKMEGEPLIPAKFDYVRAESVEQAIQLLQESDGEGKIIAGGHSLLPLMKFRVTEPEKLIDISRILNLKGCTS